MSEPRLAGWSRRSLLATVGVLSLLGLAGPAVAADEKAEAFIANVGDEVVRILQRDDASHDEKLAELKTMLDSYTDLDLVARLVLGRHWNSASGEQREEYVRLFRTLLMNTMAEQLGNYGGETFRINGSTVLNERDSQVQTQIVNPNSGQTYDVNWRVRDSDGRLAIIDLVAENVSLVVSQRNEVGSIIERQGMDGLIETMRQRSGEGETVL